jgi:hypothetical protein
MRCLLQYIQTMWRLLLPRSRCRQSKENSWKAIDILWNLEHGADEEMVSKHRRLVTIQFSLYYPIYAISKLPLHWDENLSSQRFYIRKRVGFFKRFFLLDSPHTHAASPLDPRYLCLSTKISDGGQCIFWAQSYFVGTMLSIAFLR